MFPTKEKFLELCKNDPEKLYEILLESFTHIMSLVEQQALRIKELESRLNQNSGNSSKPPSSDQFKKKRNNKHFKRKTGGQPGHTGTNLKTVSNPDEVKSYSAPTICEACNKSLEGKTITTKIGQEFDIPQVKIRVIEYRVDVVTCDCGHCNKTPQAPELKSRAYYGNRIKSLIIFCKNVHMLPYRRTKEIIYNIYGHTISEGTFLNAEQEFSEKLIPIEQEIKEQIISSFVAGFDETGVRSEKRNFWVHTAVTKYFSHFTFHAKRGLEGMIAGGILQKFKGVSVHDFFKAYLKLSCEHAFCNAHLLRELIGVYENTKQSWAEMMIEVLMTALDYTNGEKTENKETVIQEISKMYDSAILQGFKENPEAKEKIKGSRKRSKEFNLLSRMQIHKKDIMRFLENENVPFDNNRSERALRMLKVKMKVSGCFRSKVGGEIFSRIYSFIDSCKKQKKNLFEAIFSVFNLGKFDFST